MKRDNLGQVNTICKKLDQLKSHYARFTGGMMDDLPEDQFDEQQKYALNLQAKIKKLEKELALL